MSALLRAVDLVFERAGEPVFEPVSLAVHGGDVLALTGRNGAGKTTLLRALAGVIRPSAGTRSATADCALVGHLPAIKHDLTCRENLEFERAMGPPGRPAAEALARVGLAGLGRRPTRALSAGQRRRLGLARLLVRRVPIWLLDEPYASLDDEGCVIVDRLVSDHAEAGGAVVLATHQRFPDHPRLARLAVVAADAAHGDPHVDTLIDRQGDAP
ncbi:heme ABC exporter ATP-binding protein CcmA [Halomonas denitrificans]|nr:heme ABC exporter ATP-binding protein CcmA [Halomonas denitrificans]